jgi:hypothetical protein
MIAKSSDESIAPQAEPKPRRDGGAQPRKQASKSRAVVKMRRKQIIKDILAGKTQQEAGIAAGLSPKSARSQVSQIIANPNVRDALIAAMERAGMSDDYIAAQHRQLIEGTKVISATVIAPGSGADLKDANSMTKDFIEVPDLAAKAKGIEMAYKLRGGFTEKHEVDVKRHVTVVIRSFCPEEDSPTEGASA